MAQSRSHVVVCTILRVASDVQRFVAPTCAARCRESVPAKAVGVVPRAAGQPRRADDATRVTLVVLSRLIDWRRLLTVVKPETLIRWHRRGFQLFWRWKSMPRGRPRLPADLQLIADMAAAN